MYAAGEVNFPQDDSLVLVAFLPKPRDLDIARLFGWYRVPFRTAPKIIEADYIAFYQPSSFPPGERFLVKWFAPIRGVELTTRSELLRDEPNHPRANEEYYKIQLGALHFLPNSIKSGSWKRFTFLYTTGKNLSRAVVLKDLAVNENERAVLWRSLHERLGEDHIYASSASDVEIPSEIFRLLIGKLTGRE